MQALAKTFGAPDATISFPNGCEEIIHASVASTASPDPIYPVLADPNTHIWSGQVNANDVPEVVHGHHTSPGTSCQ
jgi:hypothetical protein